MSATNVSAPAVVERRLYVTLTRGDQSVKLLVGGGDVRERIKSAYAIIRWNREGRKIAARDGTEFPQDAPVHFWQINWKSVLKKGNV